MTVDPLLQGVQEDAAQDVAAAAANMAVTVELLTAAHQVAVMTGDAAGELLAAIERMSAVRDSLHEHAATLAKAGRPHPEMASAGVHLARPTSTTIRQSLFSVYGAEPAAVIWSRLLASAGVEHDNDDPATVVRLAEAMTGDGDPTVRLCGRSVQIRLTTYAYLSRAVTDSA